jgi:HK97 family phage portal protein
VNILRKMADVVRNLTSREPSNWTHQASVADSGEIVSDRSVLSLSATWACVNLLAGTIASLPLMVYRIDAKGDRVVHKSHPLYRLLHDSPNYDQTAVDFWEFLCASIELHGNAFAKIERVAGRIVALRPIAANAVTIRRLANGPLEYRWTQDGKTFVDTESAIFHIRGFGGDPLGGMSTLQFGRRAFGLSQAIDRAASNTFRNGMRPDFQLVFEKFLTPEQRAIARKELAENYFGAVNAGRPYIAEGGAKLEALSLNPEDAQMLESRSFSIEEICRFFGVPPFMVGHTEKVTAFGTGLEQQTLGFQKFTLRRRLKRIEQAIEKQLLSVEDRVAGVTVEFNLEGLLRADSLGRARYYQVMTGIGAMTINDVRLLENMPPVEGGDVPRIQMQNRPINEVDDEAIRQMIADQTGN